MCDLMLREGARRSEKWHSCGNVDAWVLGGALSQALNEAQTRNKYLNDSYVSTTYRVDLGRENGLNWVRAVCRVIPWVVYAYTK